MRRLLALGLVLLPTIAHAQSWTAPRTWTTGELVTAAIMNSAVRDNLSVLRAGGFAVTSQATGDLLCASSTTQFARLAGVASGSVLVSAGTGTCPAYSASPSLSGTLQAAAVNVSVNTGLSVRDTGNDHYLTIIPGTNLTAGRNLTLTTGDTNRTVTIGGNTTISQDYSSTGSPTFANLTVNTLITATSVNVSANTGFSIRDAGNDHYITIRPGTNATANRNLIFTPGDADRTVTISGDTTISQNYSTAGSPQFAGLGVGVAAGSGSYKVHWVGSDASDIGQLYGDGAGVGIGYKATGDAFATNGGAGIYMITTEGRGYIAASPVWTWTTSTFAITPDLTVNGNVTLGNAAGDSHTANGAFTTTGSTTIGDNAADTHTVNGIVSTTGRFNSASAQPGFLAYNSVTDANVSPGTTIDFDTEVYDEAGNFATDTFTAPVTGRYLLCAAVRFNPDSAEALVTTASIVTSNRTYRIGPEIYNTTDAYLFGGCVIADMDTSDTAHVVTGGGGSTHDIQGSASPHVTYFSGRLLP